ncbi:hypothetical protein [Aquimarina brevivitae]|uniref:Tic20 family protein n=1 Tax=Aquimarina brevivitae TaxID=323412 RepID=A0A4Q7P470_9FLAO|nr:hypothetical protein [Aquimarina brevivitae]RZS93492.1 hypothetical protein EV197_2071 [Aquimarina brevivitae]
MKNNLTANIIEFMLSLIHILPIVLVLAFAIYYISKKGWNLEGILLVAGSSAILISVLSTQLFIFIMYNQMNHITLFMYILNGLSFLGYLVLALGVLGLIKKIIKLTNSEH